MKILHICNDFLGSKVHVNLYNNISYEQYVYFPFRKHTKDKNMPQLNQNISLIKGCYLSLYHKVLFRNKINFLLNDLIKKVDINKFDLIHATTLYSDGVLAYKLFKKNSTPYVVSVRNTDVNLFLKYRPDLNILINKVLLNASEIIFVADSLHANFYSNSHIKKIKTRIIDKSTIIYNGIDEYWFNNYFRKKEKIYSTKILFVGAFDKNKNTINLIEAFNSLVKKGYDLELNLIGRNGSEEEEIKKIASKSKGINFIGEVSNKYELLCHYRNNNIFALVSKRETFGLVYIEALTQGLPILYSKGQGIDGVFEERIGEGVNPNSIESIEKGLDKLIKNYQTYLDRKIRLDKFSWSEISQQYKYIYYKNKR